MQQLFAQLAEHKYIEWHSNCPETDIVIDLFSTHSTSLDLLRVFPHVLIMDCIYKTNRYPMHLLLYGSHQRVDELLHIILYQEDCPPYDRWMMMLDMGRFISSHYNVVLYHMFVEQCLTFLPLRSVPILAVARQEIAIGFVNPNHFIRVIIVYMLMYIFFVREMVMFHLMILTNFLSRVPCRFS